MSSEKYLESVNIQYLLNPHLENYLLKSGTKVNDDFNNDVKFYKKRIVQYVKDFCKDINNNSFKINNNDKANYACFIFIKNLIEDYKFNDRKDILQEDYEEYNINSNFILENNTENDNNIIDNIELNSILLKEEKKKINLDNFVKIKNVNKREIITTKRETNIQEDYLRFKGVKKKNINNI
jgi:hypothetical protein